MMAQKGYVVASFDSRGTPAPKGRLWRKAAYKKIGITANNDQAAAVSALLRKWRFLDPERVGSWGWSGGGSSTLQAMFSHNLIMPSAEADYGTTESPGASGPGNPIPPRGGWRGQWRW